MTPLRQSYLPMFDSLVFFDWYGTLSTSRFWEGVTDSTRHPLRDALGERLKHLFTQEKPLIRSWMVGEATEAEVLERIDLRLPRNYGHDYLERRLRSDCRAARVDEALGELVWHLRQETLVVLATDNMSCFAEAIPEALSGKAPVDAILTSCHRRVLKADDPERFFGPALEVSGLSWADSVLIDDCPDTCAAFSARGGRAYHFTSVQELGRVLAFDPSPAVRRAATLVGARFGNPEQLRLFA